MASPKKVTSSKSPSRRSNLKSTKSRGRSRSRSRSRSRTRSVSRSRRTRKSVSPEKSTSPEKRTTRYKASPSRAKKTPERAATPTRKSARLENKSLAPEERKVIEFVKMDDEKKVARTTKREFGGAIGAFFMTIGLPVIVFVLNGICTKEKSCKLHLPKFSTNWRDYFDLEAAGIFVGWFLFQAILSVLPIGSLVQGQILRSGGKLNYRCNGFFALVVSLLAYAIAVYMKVPIANKVIPKFTQIMAAGTVFCFVLSILLYVKARRAPKSLLAPGGNTGNVVYDFFIGHELNPRIGSFDLKFFCELRPGLIGWLMLNLMFVTQAYNKTGEIPPALTMVAVFQGLYVADALWCEEAILTTMDILHDGFGFMLVFGDLVWVPFLYCLQTRFLFEQGFNLPWYCLAPIGILNFIGYYIFRGSNSQKNEFRKNPYNPALAHLETIPTSTGRKLLVSGWWGLCRKPNYLGDLIMATAWSLPCGFSTPIPYFYPLYFTILLIHRERRDHEHCHKKYKASWDRYCERVKYRIFPYIY